MGLLIPDIILLDTLNAILKIVRDDYANVASEQDRLLYLLFNDLTLGAYDFYENAKAILITNPTNPRHIDKVTLSYDQNSNKVPQIYLTLPSEAQGAGNSIGIGVGDQAEILMQDGTYRQVYNRRYNSTYNIMIVSDNRTELTVLYHFFKNMLVSSTQSLSLKGLENIRIGGQDLRLNNSIPEKVFLKAITFAFEYEQSVPKILTDQIRNKLFLYWKIKGAVQRNGPIVIEDDESD